MDPIQMMVGVAALLEQCGIEGTFAGGTVLAVHVDDVVREDLRPTLDVDVIVRADSYKAYQAECRKLMGVGLSPGVVDGDPLCRFRGAGLVIDLMPTPFAGVGTDNPWFGVAIRTAERVILPGGRTIRVVSAPVFLATKVAAHVGRGGGDLLLSKDFEDIVALVDGRPSLVSELAQAPGDVRQFVAEWSRQLLDLASLSDAIAGHVSRVSGPGRTEVVLARLHEAAKLARVTSPGA